MKEYPKIQTVFKRDPTTNMKTLLFGEYSMSEFFYLADNQWVFTEKVDGTNIRVMIADGRITFGGKTDAAQIPASLVERLNERFLPQTERLLEMFPDGGCLYGEGYGARIQKGGGNYRADQDFVLFDAMVGPWWLMRDSLLDIGSKLSIDVVPMVDCGTLPEMVEKASSGFNSAWGSFPAEGIVARPLLGLCTRSGQRIITKIKYKDFPTP